MPSEKSPYSYYLQLLGRWPTAIALASQWFVVFDFSTVNVLKGNLQGLLTAKEQTSQWRYNPSVTQYMLTDRLQNSQGSLIGCAFARQVTLPSETINISHEGLDYGGYMAPATANTREKYDKFSVNFLETNASFIDLIIRPWAVAVGYNGLVARKASSPDYVKAGVVDVVMLAKTGSYSPMGIRKMYRFYNVAPTTIPSEEYSYLEEGLRTSNISFAYDNYAVMDMNTNQLIQQDTTNADTTFLGI